jgi:hypothetical protein
MMTSNREPVFGNEIALVNVVGAGVPELQAVPYLSLASL